MSRSTLFALAAGVACALTGGCGPEGSSRDAGRPMASAGTLEVRLAVVPEPAGGERAAFYVDIRNTGSVVDTLLGLASPVARTGQVHRTAVEDGVSRMEPAGPVAIEPGVAVTLEPGGLHGMLMGLEEAVRAGDTIEVTLRFSAAGPLTLRVPVRTYAEVLEQVGPR